jgi:hypothetical protein
MTFSREARISEVASRTVLCAPHSSWQSVERCHPGGSVRTASRPLPAPKQPKHGGTFRKEFPIHYLFPRNRNRACGVLRASPVDRNWREVSAFPSDGDLTEGFFFFWLQRGGRLPWTSLDPSSRIAGSLRNREGQTQGLRLKLFSRDIGTRILIWTIGHRDVP